MVIKGGSMRILTPQHLTPWQSMYKGNTAFSSIAWFSFLIKTLISFRIFGSLHLWSLWKDIQKHSDCYHVVYTSLLQKKNIPANGFHLGSCLGITECIYY